MKYVIFVFCCLGLQVTTAIAQPAKNLKTLIDEIETVRQQFDRCYFESYGYSEYDELALSHDLGSTAIYEWRKIARNGVHRYSYRKTTSMPYAKIQYSPMVKVSVYDVQTSDVIENRRFSTSHAKSPSSELNTVFMALGWPEGDTVNDPTRILVPEILKRDDADWKVTLEQFNKQECYVTRSEKLAMTLWFNKTSKMPLKYEFNHSPLMPANKTVDFTDYIDLKKEGMQFPGKIVVACELFDPAGKLLGNSKVTIEISNPSLEPDPKLFNLEMREGNVVIE